MYLRTSRRVRNLKHGLIYMRAMHAIDYHSTCVRGGRCELITGYMHGFALLCVRRSCVSSLFLSWRCCSPLSVSAVVSGAIHRQAPRRTSSQILHS
ncbi:multidrug and toxic compound extrusion3 [Zea mays]|uniref:Multidrug and toxic compound extrusion3 n=1 Tax=Zea mays TaxID=4577 RepID=A0A1D6JTD1_MAIZE|nr:multidrug and toxic compound extrusion3 [Zea mays]